MYYGSTTETLKERKRCHIKDYKRFLNGKRNYVTSFEIIKLGDWDILLVEDFPCNSKKELEAREGYYIKRDFCFCVNKCIAGRTVKVCYKDNKEKKM